MGGAPQVLDIGGDRWRVGVLPGTGASLAYGRVRTPDGRWGDLLRPTRAAALTKPPLCASYVLVPFSNRVRDGVLRFGDRTWQLRCNSGDGHAMHGTGFESAWEVAERSDAAVSLVLDTGGLVGANFPWSFRAEVRYAVDGPRLTIGTRLTNTADEPFPAGFGHHPFFQRGLVDPAVSEVRLQVPAEGAYPMRDSIPVGPAGAVPARADYREIRVLDEVYVNDCLTRAPGSAPVRMEWPMSGVVLAMDADPVLAHTLVYAPRHRPYFAVEPVTNANDGFNLMADGVPGHGVFVLEPGETRSGDIRLGLEVLGAV